jgi:hypothetical protein
MNISVSQIYFHVAIFSLALFTAFGYFNRLIYKKNKQTVTAFSMLESVSLVNFAVFLTLIFFRNEGDRQGCIIMAIMLMIFIPRIFWRESNRKNLTCWDKNQILFYSLLSLSLLAILVYNNLFI